MNEEMIQQVITDIENISNGHKLEASMITGTLDWQQREKLMHQSKAAAFDFVVRKLKRKFNLTNDTDSRISFSTP